MFSKNDISGLDLNDKTLCLTYDDGPGQYSLEIAKFLHGHGVRATFFVVGKFAIEHQDVLDQMHDLNHIIGNHTFEHPDMPIYVGNNGDIRDQINRTNSLIEKYNQDGLIYFRAPYGKWSPEVANELNHGLKSSHKMCGPIYWEIPGIDCYFWKLGKSVDETVSAYLEEIEKFGKGVIVMHDEIADMDSVKPLNKTLELTKALIPILLDKGYKFIGLDEINAIRLKDPLEDSFSLVSPNGYALSYEDAPNGRVYWAGKNQTSSNTQLVMKNRNEGKVCLMTKSGKFLRANPDENTCLLLSDDFDAHCLFDYIPLFGKWQYFRGSNGYYIGGKGAEGSAVEVNAPFMLQALKLAYKPSKYAYEPPMTWKQKLLHVKKKLLFIKSKILR